MTRFGNQGLNELSAEKSKLSAEISRSIGREIEFLGRDSSGLELHLSWIHRDTKSIFLEVSAEKYKLSAETY